MAGERESAPGSADAGGGAATERFQPNSGRLTGVIGLVLVTTAVVLVIVERDVDTLTWMVPAALLTGVVIWIFLFRPAVSVVGDDLVLRGAVSTTYVPLAAIEDVGVGRVLAVSAGGRRYVSGAIGRGRREAARDDRLDASSVAGLSYGGYVEQRLSGLVKDALMFAHVTRHSPEQAALAEGVRRTWAWPEIAALVVTAIVLLVVALVG